MPHPACAAARPPLTPPKAITTNGLTLGRKLPALVEAGLTHVNLSLDTLLDFKYEIVTRRRGHARVLRALDAAVEAGLRVKLNCVVMQGFNEDELCDFVGLTRDRAIDVRFIEYMPFSGNGVTPPESAAAGAAAERRRQGGPAPR